MGRAIDSRFYKQAQWIKCRSAYLKQQPLCEICLKHGEYIPSKYVHHIVELTEDNVKDSSIAYGFDNLMALCFDCHEKQHRNKSKKRYRIKDDGSVEIIC